MLPTSSTHPTVTAAEVLDALGADGFAIGPGAPVSHRVLDTFDGRLHAAGLELQLEGGADPALVLRSVAAGASMPPARLAWSGPAPSWPHDLPSGPFRSRLAAVTKERALVTLLVFEGVARVARRFDKRGKAIVAVELLDRIDAPGPAGEPPAWVATVVPVVGHDAAAAETEARLRQFGVLPEPVTAAAVVAAATGESIAGATSSPTVPLQPGFDALFAFREVLANLASTIEANLHGTIDDIDSEFLHELRVAVRRTRSVLAQGKGVIPAEVRSRFGEGFRWLGQITTDPRDLDVYLLGWADYVSPLPDDDARRLEPARAELEARRVASHVQLAADLRSERASALRADWRRWLLHGPAARPEDRRPIGPFVARRIERLQHGLLGDGRAITEESPGERLHDLRKDAKKLRYLLECFGSLLAAKPRKAFVGQLKDLQDNLGEHQDAEVHVDQLRALARDLHGREGTSVDLLLAMGRLSDHLDRRRQSARDEFAERFAAYDTKANRRRLDELLEPLRHQADRPA